MTYKYLHIRRAFFEANLTSKLIKNRSISDMLHLFKPLFGIMFLIFITSSIWFFTLFFIEFQSPILWIPASLIIIITILSQIFKEKHFYKHKYRSNELMQIMNDYENYIAEVCRIFKEYKIDTKDKLITLKMECESMIKSHDEKYTGINNRIFEMLIGVPLGALIASIIYSDSAVISASIYALIIIGFMIMTVVKIIKIIDYFSEGNFKDKYLLDIINEVYYQDELNVL